MCLQSLGLGLSAITVDFYWYLCLFFLFNAIRDNCQTPPMDCGGGHANMFSSLSILTQPCCSDLLLSPPFYSTSHFLILGSLSPCFFFCSSRLKLLTLHLWSINLLGGRRETYERELVWCVFCLFFVGFWFSGEFGLAKLVPHWECQISNLAHGNK